LFPDAEHFITHYKGKAGTMGESGPRIWNSHVLLHERYVLTMQFDMALGADGLKVIETGQPTDRLSEITGVKVAPSGQVSIMYGDSVQFGPNEWKALEASKGDLSAVGIRPKSGQPVPNLKANWREA